MLLQFAPAPATTPWSGVLLVHSHDDPDMTTAAGDVAAALLQLGLDVELCDVATATDIDPERHDVVIVGASLGDRDRFEMAAWISSHRRSLDDRPTALFTVCPAGCSKQARDEVRRGLDVLVGDTGWLPSRTVVIGDPSAVARFAENVAIVAAAPLAA